MDLKALKAALAAAQEARKALFEGVDGITDRATLDKQELEIRKKDIEIKGLQEQIASLEAQEGGEDPAARKNPTPTPSNQLNPVASYRTATNNSNLEEDSDDPYGSLEYRKAFKNYVQRGTPIPEKFATRSNELTTTSDLGAVIIPTTITNKVIEDKSNDGKVFPRLNQTAFQSGVKIPISDIKPEGHWLDSEDDVSDEQKAAMKASLQFGAYVLESKIAVSLVASVLSLDMFESTIVRTLKKANTISIEKAYFAGSGNGQPLGVTKLTLPTSQIVTANADEIGTVAKWAAVEAAVDDGYDDGLVYHMNKATWELYLNGMTDKNGQKIGLGKINEKGQKILNGREVITTNNIKSFDSASEGDIVAALVPMEEYTLNSNLAMYYRKYFDEEKNKYVHKTLMIADGKPLVGTVGEGETAKLVNAGGFVYLKKSAAV